jgi:hypothetical protein
MVGRVGLEPTTNGLKGRCSTTELPTREALQGRDSRGNRQRRVKLLQFAARCQPAGRDVASGERQWARRGHPPVGEGSKTVSVLSEHRPAKATGSAVPALLEAPSPRRQKNLPSTSPVSSNQPMANGNPGRPPLPAPRSPLPAPRPDRRRTDAHGHHGLQFHLARHPRRRKPAPMRPTLIFLLLSLLSKTLAGPLDFWTCTLVLTNASVSDAIFANGRFIVSVGAGATGGRSSTLVSDDGATWRETREEWFRSFHQGNGVIVAVGSDSIASSSDGASWVARRPFRVAGLRGFTFGQGRFLAQVGSGSVVDPISLWTSADGIGWAIVATNFWPESFARISFVPELSYSGDRWVTLTEPFTERPLLLPEPL